MIFYHFHGFRILSKYYAVPGLCYDKIFVSKSLKKLYHFYLTQLIKEGEILSNINNISIRHTNSNRILELVLNDNFFFIIRSKNTNTIFYIVNIAVAIRTIILSVYLKLNHTN